MTAHRLPQPCLVVLVGPPAAGKSAWAAEHLDPRVVVSSDALRGVVGEDEHDIAASTDAFAVLEQVVAARLARRLTTVVDTMGLDRERRLAWLAQARAASVPAVVVAFDTPPAECRRRNAARPHRVPAAVMTSRLAAYAAQRAGLDAEGWDEVLAPTPVRLTTPEVAAAARVAAVESPVPQIRRLRFGLYLSTWAPPGGAADLRAAVADVARRAEAAGFDAIWVMDHFRQIPQVGRAWDDMLEPVATLGYLAASTSRVDLGCLVHGVTLRNVGLLAKSLATVDVLSGGRAWCGLGAGWFDAEQRAYGFPVPSRAERLDHLEEALQALPLLWGRGAPAFAGRYVDVPEALGYPRPLRGRIPILVGGQGPRRTLRLAATYADACNLRGGPADVRSAMTTLRAHCADVGRDPAAIEVTHLSTALVASSPSELAVAVERYAPRRGRDAWAQHVNPGTVEDHVLRVRALVDAGVDHVVVHLVGTWDGHAVETWGRVVSALRA